MVTTERNPQIPVNSAIQHVPSALMIRIILAVLVQPLTQPFIIYSTELRPVWMCALMESTKMLQLINAFCATLTAQPVMDNPTTVQVAT